MASYLDFVLHEVSQKQAVSQATGYDRLRKRTREQEAKAKLYRKIARLKARGVPVVQGKPVKEERTKSSFNMRAYDILKQREKKEGKKAAKNEWAVPLARLAISKVAKSTAAKRVGKAAVGYGKKKAIEKGADIAHGTIDKMRDRLNQSSDRDES